MSEFIETLAQEETDLTLHSRLCAQRYQQITDRLSHMDQRFDRIETTLADIKQVITINQQGNMQLYLSWAAGIITILTGAVGFMISHYVLR
jgi:hypothetical protein